MNTMSCLWYLCILSRLNTYLCLISELIDRKTQPPSTLFGALAALQIDTRPWTLGCSEHIVAEHRYGRPPWLLGNPMNEHESFQNSIANQHKLNNTPPQTKQS